MLHKEHHTQCEIEAAITKRTLEQTSTEQGVTGKPASGLMVILNCLPTYLFLINP